MSLHSTSAEQLLGLANTAGAVDRGQLLLAVVDACRLNDETAPRLRSLLSHVFMSLITDVERDIRLLLAEKIASEAWAPHALVLTLIDDEIEIARPVIAQSPVLLDHDLIRLLVNATIDHQIEVARRPFLSRAVVETIVDQGEPDVLAALCANTKANISPLAMARLVRFSRRMMALRAPLTRHPGLTSDLAGVLYGWVGETLRAGLVQRYALAGSVLDTAVAQTVQETQGAIGWNATDPDDMSDRVLTEQRLVQKLQGGGQLRAGLLVRALQEGKLTLFKTGLATLGDIPLTELTLAMDADRPDQLGAICTAVGIDRSVFPTVLRLVRRLNGDRPGQAIPHISPQRNDNHDVAARPRRYLGV